MRVQIFNLWLLFRISQNTYAAARVSFGVQKNPRGQYRIPLFDSVSDFRQFKTEISSKDKQIVAHRTGYYSSIYWFTEDFRFTTHETKSFSQEMFFASLSIYLGAAHFWYSIHWLCAHCLPCAWTAKKKKKKEEEKFINLFERLRGFAQNMQYMYVRSAVIWFIIIYVLLMEKFAKC